MVPKTDICPEAIDNDEEQISSHTIFLSCRPGRDLTIPGEPGCTLLTDRQGAAGIGSFPEPNSTELIKLIDPSFLFERDCSAKHRQNRLRKTSCDVNKKHAPKNRDRLSHRVKYQSLRAAEGCVAIRPVCACLPRPRRRQAQLTGRHAVSLRGGGPLGSARGRLRNPSSFHLP